MSRKVQEFVTRRIVELIEQGSSLVWEKPWAGGAHKNLASGRSYRGVNQVLCSLTAMVRGFASPHWMTLGQVLQRGGRVKREEFANYTPIVLWKEVRWSIKNSNGQDEHRSMLAPCRFFKVWNLDQATCVEAPSPVEKPAVTQVAAIEGLIAALPEQPDIRRGGDRAFYSPSGDYICLPQIESFVSAEAEAGTRVHEVSHWTGHPTRLNRKTLAQASFFGSQNYSEEEITVELATSWILAHVGLEEATLNRSAAYIQTWCAALKEDSRAIFRCSAQAQRIFDYIVGQEKVEPTASASPAEQIA